MITYKMDFIHAREYLNNNQVIKVDCDTQCNVMLTSDSDFQNYKNGRSFHYFGGFFKEFPAFIRPPQAGNWNITIDLGGGRANIRYSITVVTPPS